MQLSLLSRTAPSSSEARTGPSTQPGAWRDSAISQLDSLAAANERVALQSLPGRMFAAAGLLVSAVLGAALLWPAPGQPPSARAATAPALVAAVAQIAPSAPADPVPGAGAAPLDTIASVPVTDEPSVPALGADDEEARKARAVRRKAALLAQERERADEEARRQMQALATQRDDAERARQDEARQVQAQAQVARERAAEPARRPDTSTPPAAPVGRRGVSEQCTVSGGVASEQACHVRSCWRAENRADPVCVQLQEAEALRAQRGSDR
jgi:hypothetical protein